MILIRLSLYITGLLLIAFGSLNSQIRLDNWVAHTSLVKTQSMDIDSRGRIWVASSGGVYSIKPDGSEYKVFRNIDQMLDIDISTIKIHPVSGEVFAGSSKGYLDILDIHGNWKHITDIFSQKFSNPRIIDIAFDGDYAYIAGGFGLAVYDSKRGVFDETVRRFANFNANNPVNRVIIKDGKIWVATSGGIAVAKLGTTLANPANWTGYKSNPGLFESAILDIAFYDGTIYAMSEKFITVLINDTLREERGTNNNRYTSIYSDDEYGFIYSDLFNMLDYNNKLISNIPHAAHLNGFLPYNHNGKKGFVIEYESNGIGIFVNDEFTHFLPDSPLINVSRDLSVDKFGNLWVATEIDPSGKGIAKFDGKHWTNFTAEKYPEMKYNNYPTITTSDDGRIFAGGFGTGLLVIEPDGDDYKFKLFDTSNSVLFGLSVAPTYIVCGKPKVDNSGNVWVPILGNQSSGPSLVAFDKNYKSYGYVNPRNPIQRFFSSLAIDFNGTKWVGGSPIEGVGMMYYNDKGSFENTSDDISGFLTQNDYPNILDNTHSVVEVDKSGFVWIGTPRGLAVISNPSGAISTQKNINIRSLNRLIGEKNINFILVDAQNNKWLATNNGVWVINADGSDTLGTVNMTNSPLPTDEILSIGYNAATGQIYFGSKQGIYEASSLSVQPASDYDIVCYPQPFNLSRDSELVIDGLEEFSDIRIVTVSGTLVRKMLVNSKKAVWDGRDENGNKAPNGIYLVLATSSTTKNSSVQKIAVIGAE